MLTPTIHHPTANHAHHTAPSGMPLPSSLTEGALASRERGTNSVRVQIRIPSLKLRRFPTPLPKPAAFTSPAAISAAALDNRVPERSSGRFSQR